MRLAILLQSFGRFGGAERVALSHYLELRRMGCDVTLFYDGTFSEGWRKRLENEFIDVIPSGISRSPKALARLVRFLNKLPRFHKPGSLWFDAIEGSCHFSKLFFCRELSILVSSK